MEPRAVDHVNIHIPDTRVDEAVAFYRDTLGLGAENLEAYREGERPLFSFRVSPTAVIHVSPVEPSSFSEPDRESYDHFALVFDTDVEEMRETLEDAGVTIRRTSNPLGATGRNPAIYVEDPFGYVLELKTAL